MTDHGYTVVKTDLATGVPKAMKALRDLGVTNSSEGGISASFRGARLEVFL